MSVIKRRQFLQSTLAAIPAALVPGGRLLTAGELGAVNDIEAVTGDRKEILLKGADVKDFAARLRGDLLLRDSAGYESARHVWNGAFDRHPALIARCTGAADVMEAVNFAAANRLLVSVRGGGHSLSGQSVCDKGLMIDLSQMNGARVDPGRRIATIEGGALIDVMRGRPRSRVLPFVTVGGGYLRQLHEGDTLVQAGKVFYAGGGARIPFVSRGADKRLRQVGVRIDLRALLRSSSVMLDGESHVSPALAASLFVRF